MNNLLIVASIVILGVFIVLFVIKKWLGEFSEKNKQSDELVAWLKSISEQLSSSNQNIDKKLTDNITQFSERLDKATMVMGDVKKNIGEFAEIGRGMKELQEFLQSPKLRGNIGEQVLKDLLQQFFPKQSFALQYAFASGEKVDALIKTSNGSIAIDAKFPLENFKKMLSDATAAEKNQFKKDFNKDVKKHINDIARKYIVPAEGTVDYALMYIPSESVYYEIINDHELYDYSSSQRVLIVSPMSFYAYMKAILMSFEGQKIEEKAKEILTLLQSLKNDYGKTERELFTLNSHLTNAYNKMNDVTRSYATFGQKLESTNLLTGSDKKLVKGGELE